MSANYIENKKPYHEYMCDTCDFWCLTPFLGTYNCPNCDDKLSINEDNIKLNHENNFIVS